MLAPPGVVVVSAAMALGWTESGWPFAGLHEQRAAAARALGAACLRCGLAASATCSTSQSPSLLHLCPSSPPLTLPPLPAGRPGGAAARGGHRQRRGRAAQAVHAAGGAVCAARGRLHAHRAHGGAPGRRRADRLHRIRGPGGRAAARAAAGAQPAAARSAGGAGAAAMRRPRMLVGHRLFPLPLLSSACSSLAAT